MNQFVQIDPLAECGWDDKLVKTKDYSFFHSSAWARVLIDTYHFKPRYLSISENDTLLTALAFMETRDFFGRKKGVSLPFSDYCPPIAQDFKEKEMIFSRLLSVARQYEWTKLNLYGWEGCLSQINNGQKVFLHTLPLTDEKKVQAGLRDSTKRNIHSAAKKGVTVVFENTPYYLQKFHYLNCLTRRRHGLPPQPQSFLKAIDNHIFKKGLGIIGSAIFDNKVIASNIYFHFGKKVIYKYGASDSRFQQLRANNLVMWEAIRRYISEGYSELSFGKTEPEHTGLMQFKDGWGAQKTEVSNYIYSMKTETFLSVNSLTSGIHNRVFELMPIPFLQMFGNLFYRFSV